MLFGLTYALNLSYPVELKYTFETFQTIIMDIESRQMSRRIQNLSAKLQEWKLVNWNTVFGLLKECEFYMYIVFSYVIVIYFYVFYII